MEESHTLSTVMIEPKTVINDRNFWNYFLTYAFLQRFRPEKEKRLKEYLEKKYPVDYEWVEKFTNCATPGIEDVDFVKMLSFHNMPGNVAGSEIYFYKDDIKYSRSENGIRLSGRRFLSRTKKWSLKERLLLCPFVTVEEHDENTFLKVIKGALTEIGIEPKEVEMLAGLMLDCCKEERLFPKADKENVKKIQDKEKEKAINRWNIGIALSVLFAFFAGIIFKQNSWIGPEGLKLVMVSGFKWLPFIVFMAISAVEFWIVMYKDIDKKQKEKNLSFVESGKRGLLIGFLFALPVMIIAAWGGCYVLKNSVYALVDYINPVIESVTLENPTFKKDDGYVTGRHGKRKVEPAHYELKSENTDIAFNIPLNSKLKDTMEDHIINGVTVYYYKNSHIVQSIRCGGEILIGE